MILGLGLLFCLGARGEMNAAPPPLACEGPRALPLSVRRGDYVHVVAEQGVRDVAVTLFDRTGRRLLKVDSLTAGGAPWPAEEVHWVAKATGDLRFEVELHEGPRGPCPLRLDAQRRATPADRARTLAETALAQAHELRRTQEENRCRKAIALYQQAQKRFADLGLPSRRTEALRGESMVRQDLGELRFRKGDLDGAIVEYGRALSLRRDLGNRAGEALTANNLGLALHLRGRYDEAAALFERALALGQKDDPLEGAKTHLNRGQLHLDLGETERARQRFREALVLYWQAPDGRDRRSGEAAAWNAMGKAFLEDKSPSSALQPLQKALALRQPQSRGQAVTLTTLGVVYRQLNRLEEARRAYAKALPVFVRFGDTREQAVCLLNLGWLEAAAGHDDPAFGDFERASGLLAKLGDPPNLALALRGKAEVLRHRGLLEDTRQAMEAALTPVERHRFRQESRTTRTSFFATQQPFYDFLIDLLMEMHRGKPDAGYDAQAFGVGERALARSLFDALASGTELRGAPPQLLARKRGLEAAIDDLSARQTQLAERGETAARRELHAIDAGLAQKREDLEWVSAELRVESPRYAALTQPRTWSAAEVQSQLLDRDTLLLEYRLGLKRSFLWALTPDSLKSFDLPGRAELAEKVSQVSGLLARSRAKKAEISADLQLAKLSQVLLGPVAALLPGKRLLVVGDGALQTLPFAALPEPGGGEPLVAHHEIVSLPSISVLGALRREVAGRRPAARTLWVLGDPDFGGAFTPLPYTREEAKAILALAPAGERTAILGREASRGAVLGGPLSDYRFLHFATHGSFAASDPGGGQLVLSQVDPSGRRVADGFLHLADIYGLELRADLVVLSACQSALGRDVRGEGLTGMTRGFFYAGAERVLVSLWNVNDRVTVDLMQTFYHGIFAEGLSPAAALRAAQDAIRRQERWRSPYYWAGFTLQGEWRGR